MIKQYEVELRRTTYVARTVEAATAEDAGTLALEECTNDDAWELGGYGWEVETITEVATERG